MKNHRQGWIGHTDQSVVETLLTYSIITTVQPSHTSPLECMAMGSSTAYYSTIFTCVNLPKQELRNCPGRNALVIIVKMYIYDDTTSIVLSGSGLNFLNVYYHLLPHTTYLPLGSSCGSAAPWSPSRVICSRSPSAKGTVKPPHLSSTIKQTW